MDNYRIEGCNAWLCGPCNRKFTSAGAIKDHLANSEYHSFCCIECDKRFVSQAALDAHCRYSPKHKPQPICCLECNRSFISQAALDVHLRDSPKHTPQPICCLKCNRSFTSQAALDAHLRDSPKHTTLSGNMDMVAHRSSGPCKPSPAAPAVPSSRVTAPSRPSPLPSSAAQNTCVAQKSPSLGATGNVSSSMDTQLFSATVSSNSVHSMSIVISPLFERFHIEFEGVTDTTHYFQSITSVHGLRSLSFEELRLAQTAHLYAKTSKSTEPTKGPKAANTVKLASTSTQTEVIETKPEQVKSIATQTDCTSPEKRCLTKVESTSVASTISVASATISVSDAKSGQRYTTAELKKLRKPASTVRLAPQSIQTQPIGVKPTEFEAQLAKANLAPQEKIHPVDPKSVSATSSTSPISAASPTLKTSTTSRERSTSPCSTTCAPVSPQQSQPAQLEALASILATLKLAKKSSKPKAAPGDILSPGLLDDDVPNIATPVLPPAASPTTTATPGRRRIKVVSVLGAEGWVPKQEDMLEKANTVGKRSKSPKLVDDWVDDSAKQLALDELAILDFSPV